MKKTLFLPLLLEKVGVGLLLPLCCLIWLTVPPGCKKDALKTSMRLSFTPTRNFHARRRHFLLLLTAVAMLFICECKKEHDYREAFTGEYQTLKKGHLAPWGWGQDIEEEVVLVVRASAKDSTVYIEEKPKRYVGEIKISEMGDFGKNADSTCADYPIRFYTQFCGHIRNDSLYIDCFLTHTGYLEYSGVKIK